jgi:hypothetical protein
MPVAMIDGLGSGGPESIVIAPSTAAHPKKNLGRALGFMTLNFEGGRVRPFVYSCDGKLICPEFVHPSYSSQNLALHVVSGNQRYAN